MRVFVPYETNPRSYLFEQIRAVVLFLLPFVLLLLLGYVTWPVAWKAWLRARSERSAWKSERPTDTQNSHVDRPAD